MTTQPLAPALAGLPADEWRIFHEVRWAGDRFAGIDHVVVGPQGVFVVHAESWSGAVDVEGGRVRHDGRRQRGPVEVTVRAARTIRGLLPGLTADTVRPVLCVTRAEPVFGWVGQMMVCSAGNLATLITSRPAVLEERAVHETAQALGRAFYGQEDTGRASGRSGRSAPRRTRPHRRPGGLRPAPHRRRTRRRPTGRRCRGPLTRVVAPLVASALGLAGFFVVTGSSGFSDLSVSMWRRLGNPEATIGEQISVRGTGRPHLDVIAQPPVRTTSRTPGERARPGRVLLAVPLSIHNDGPDSWSPGRSASAALVEESTTVIAGEERFRRVSAGRVLDLGAEVPAGRTTRGVVVFEVPRKAQLVEVQLTVGPGVPKTLHWELPAD